MDAQPLPGVHHNELGSAVPVLLCSFCPSSLSELLEGFCCFACRSFRNSSTVFSRRIFILGHSCASSSMRVPVLRCDGNLLWVLFRSRGSALRLLEAALQRSLFSLARRFVSSCCRAHPHRRKRLPGLSNLRWRHCSVLHPCVVEDFDVSATL